MSSDRIQIQPGAATQTRSGALFHANAVKERERLVVTFEDHLDASAIRLMKQDQADVVSGSHVTRAYQTIVPPGYYQRVRAALASAVFGAAFSAFIAFGVASEVPGIMASALCAIASAIWMTSELRRG